MAAELILQLAVILLFAKAFGEFFKHFGMPSLLGEVLAGIILGPAILGFISSDGFFKVLSEIGIILLIFIAGFEQGNIQELLKHKNTSILISALSSTLPIIAVVIITQLQGYSLLTSLFLAVGLGATSMGVSLRSLMSVGEAETKVGKTVIGSLVINDITGLLLLTGVATYGTIITAGTGNIYWELFKAVLGVAFCFFLFYVGMKTIPKLTHRFIKLRVEEAQFTIALIIILFLAWFATTFGLSSIIGAFFAGLILSRSPVFETKNFHKKIFSLGYGFFIPIFFVVTGTHLDFANFWRNALRALLFLGVITTVQVGCAYLASKINGYTSREATIIGFGMLPYGEVTLIVMSSLLTLSSTYTDFFAGEDITGLFSSVLILILLTVVLTPLAMRAVNKVANHT